jgi:phenylacetate-CoA ligase
MHLNADALIVEVERSANHPAGTGRVLVTDLLNRAMPLIRYEIGDTASSLETAPCPCGRVFPRIRNVRGRVTDFLVTPDNERISGVPLAAIAGDLPQVRQLQLIQKDAGHVQVKVVPGREYSANTVAELRHRLNAYFHGKTELSIVTAERILPERSGKVRLTRSYAGLDESFERRRTA